MLDLCQLHWDYCNTIHGTPQREKYDWQLTLPAAHI
jgi:hypothetical protein